MNIGEGSLCTVVHGRDANHILGSALADPNTMIDLDIIPRVQPTYKRLPGAVKAAMNLLRGRPLMTVRLGYDESQELGAFLMQVSDLKRVAQQDRMEQELSRVAAAMLTQAVTEETNPDGY